MFAVADQDAALAFYTEKLGFEVRSDSRFGENGEYRWLEVAPPGSTARLALNPPMGGQPGGGAIGVETPDVLAEHARLTAIGGIDLDPEPMRTPRRPAAVHAARPGRQPHRRRGGAARRLTRQPAQRGGGGLEAPVPPQAHRARSENSRVHGPQVGRQLRDERHLPEARRDRRRCPAPPRTARRRRRSGETRRAR